MFLGEHDEKLLPAVAVDAVAQTSDEVERRRDGAERGVAGHMSPAVVVRLEVVYVAHGEGVAAAVAGAGGVQRGEVTRNAAMRRVSRSNRSTGLVK